MTDAQGQLRQAAHEIQRYLSDEIAPLLAVGGRLLAWGAPPGGSALFAAEPSPRPDLHVRRRVDVPRPT